jgi:hypothetical protein
MPLGGTLSRRLARILLLVLVITRLAMVSVDTTSICLSMEIKMATMVAGVVMYRNKIAVQVMLDLA